MPISSVGRRAIRHSGRQLYAAPLRKDVPIADRTGGGDSFASGVMAALLKGKDLDTAVHGRGPRHPRARNAGDITLIEEPLLLAEVKRGRAGGGVKATR